MTDWDDFDDDLTTPFTPIGDRTGPPLDPLDDDVTVPVDDSFGRRPATMSREVRPEDFFKTETIPGPGQGSAPGPRPAATQSLEAREAPRDNRTRSDAATHIDLTGRGPAPVQTTQSPPGQRPTVTPDASPSIPRPPDEIVESLRARAPGPGVAWSPPVRPTSPEPPAYTGGKTSRARRRWLLAAMVVGCLLVGGAIWWQIGGGDSPQPDQGSGEVVEP